MKKPSADIDQELIERIVSRIRDVTHPQRIILFGSAASGQMNRDSDIDLIVLENTITDAQAEWLTIQKALRGMGYPFDIIVMEKNR
ncbi:MAG: nucleotidyltransferase domain-containing protein [Candidatus Sumerlaeota bacterium]|nr:nucleotidyltransferase domain-containing protein [Candidatus Sumerlaeota bacterium]